MCPEWLNNYFTFKDWSIKNGYVENTGLSIDRIDPEDNYNPKNCRWISFSENSGRANLGRQKNKSHNGKMFAINPSGIIEEITNVSEFSRTYNLNRSSVSHRLNGRINGEYKGWIFYRENTTKGVTTIENIA